MRGTVYPRAVKPELHHLAISAVQQLRQMLFHVLDIGLVIPVA